MPNNISAEELEKLYELARNARKTGDALHATEYYQKIAEVDSGKWEPYFYSNDVAYFPPNREVDKGTKKSIEGDLDRMWSLLINTVEVIAAEQGIDKSAAVIELYYYFSDNYKNFIFTLEHQAHDLTHADSNYATYNGVSPKVELNLVGCVAYRYAKMSYEFGDSIVSNGLNCNAPTGVNVAADCWNIGNNMIGFAYATMTYPIVKDSQKFLSDYTAKIRQYAPSYQPPVLPKAKKSGCYIATCVYGTYDCPQLWTLRRYRDERLAEKALGRAFIRAYYAVSPMLVRWFGSCNWFKKLWKPMLDRMVDSLRAKGFKDTPYQDR